jgi:hypothetical protein
MERRPLLGISVRELEDILVGKKSEKWHSRLIHRASVFAHEISIVIISNHHGWLLSNC